MNSDLRIATHAQLVPAQSTTASQRLDSHLSPMSPAANPRDSAAIRQRDLPEHPVTVREAARFLGVSPQTVYLWVERRQIPHLRVMGRKIRFLTSELAPFRAQFRQEVENGKAE
jgi:excisionase family DNA binding protein